MNAGHGLRSIYQRYLESYERNQFFTIKSFYLLDDQDSSSLLWDSDHTESCKNVRPPCFTGEIPNHLRETWHLSTDLVDKMEHVLLERSLLSLIPNEIELALNTMLLMSSQPNLISFYNNPKLLDLLLASVGIMEKSRILLYSFLTFSIQSRFRRYVEF